jgi:hypothetical protein
LLYGPPRLLDPDRRGFLKEKRHDFFKITPASALGAVAQLLTTDAFGKEAAPMHSEESFWPDGARLSVSISMQFEAGA